MQQKGGIGWRWWGWSEVQQTHPTGKKVKDEGKQRERKEKSKKGRKKGEGRGVALEYCMCSSSDHVYTGKAPW